MQATVFQGWLANLESLTFFQIPHRVITQIRRVSPSADSLLRGQIGIRTQQLLTSRVVTKSLPHSRGRYNGPRELANEDHRVRITHYQGTSDPSNCCSRRPTLIEFSLRSTTDSSSLFFSWYSKYEGRNKSNVCHCQVYNVLKIL